MGGWGNATNLMSLVSIQGSNAIFPLIIYPYLLHVVGVHFFSDIVWTEALNLIALNVVLYSFDVDGMRRLATVNAKVDSIACSNVFYAIFWSRIFLFIITTLLILVGVFIFARNSFMLSLFWLLFIIGQIFQSSWFYLSIEKNQYLAKVTIISRLVGAAAIFLFVRHGSQYALVPLIIGSSYFISGVLAFAYAIRKFQLVYQKPSAAMIISYLKSGRHIFSGNICVVLFRGSNIIILKMLSLDVAVSTYAIAEKVIKCVQSAVRPINQFYYPKVIRDFQTNAANMVRPFKIIRKYTRKQLMLVLVFWIVVFLGLFIYSSQASGLASLSGRVFMLIGIMSCAVVFGICNYMFGTIGLNNLGLANRYAQAIIIAGLLTIVISVSLVVAYGDIGAAIAYMLGEFILFVLVMRRISDVNCSLAIYQSR